jgi:hypothetical protein
MVCLVEQERQYNGHNNKTDNTMDKTTRQDHTMDKTTRLTIQWTKQQDKQYNGQNNKTDHTMDTATRQTIIMFEWSDCLLSCLNGLIVFNHV